MVEGMPVLKTLLNWRGCLSVLLALALVVLVPAAAHAKVQPAGHGKKVMVTKVSARASKAKGPSRTSSRLASSVARDRQSAAGRNARAVVRTKVAVKTSKRMAVQLRHVTKSSQPIRRVSYMRAPTQQGLIRSVNIQAEPPPLLSGRTVIASPQLSNAARMSFGQLYGLHHTADPLALKSSVAFVVDQDTDEVLVSKNSEAVLPIASLTKLMTAMVVLDARQPMDELIEVTQEDVDTEKNSSSRLAVGTTLTRGEALHLALMSSENRAAHVLGRYYPGGLRAFVPAMNQKSRQLGMFDSHFVDPTGLNSQNQSSAKDLVSLVKAASQKALIRELSVSLGYVLQSGPRLVQFRNTNSLVHNPSWSIGLQKTGYIVEAGRCLVMQARMAGRRLIMVFLDSAGKYSRLGDAERVRHWLENATLEQLSSPTTAPPPVSTISIYKATS
jgi:D-alanyl-D-alanine endopeptidase (penicillin-binding protein 7)